MDGGLNTDACLALGRRLVEQVEPYDLAGQWMAHHLAELVTAAEDETATTLDQRIQIVETVLRLWMNRRSLPGKVPGYDLDRVFAALDRLGDERPWRYVRLPFDPDPHVRQLPLVAAAAELERLVRGSVITLILLAHNEARESASEWLEASNALNADIEGELASVSRRIDRQLRLYRSATPDEDGDTADAEPDGSLRPTEEDDQLSDTNHARRLREMADLLNTIAAALDEGQSKPSTA